jgi:hypothetical protein
MAARFAGILWECFARRLYNAAAWFGLLWDLQRSRGEPERFMRLFSGRGNVPIDVEVGGQALPALSR